MHLNNSAGRLIGPQCFSFCRAAVARNISVLTWGLFMVFISGTTEIVFAEPVPSAWLDSLSAYQWRMEWENVVESYRVRTVERKLKKDLSVKDSTLSWNLVEFMENSDTLLIFSTDEKGTFLDDDPEIITDEEQDKISEILGSPMEAFKDRDKRVLFEYSLLPPGDDGFVRLRATPRDFYDQGWVGTVKVDTTDWSIHHFLGYPYDYPTGMRELVMELTFESSRDGYMVVNSARTYVYMKILFVTRHLETVQYHFDYQFRED